MNKRPIKNIAGKESLDVENKGLRLSWIKFIDAYVKNGGNGTRAYMVAYPESNYKAANANAQRLIVKDSIREEINNRLQTQRVTDEFIISGLADIAVSFRKAKTIMAAVKSYEILARIRGLLTDTKRVEFTGENPAVFLSPFSKERKEELDKMFQPIEGKVQNRITE